MGGIKTEKIKTELDPHEKFVQKKDKRVERIKFRHKHSRRLANASKYASFLAAFAVLYIVLEDATRTLYDPLPDKHDLRNRQQLYHWQRRPVGKSGGDGGGGSLRKPFEPQPWEFVAKTNDRGSDLDRVDPFFAAPSLAGAEEREKYARERLGLGSVREEAGRSARIVSFTEHHRVSKLNTLCCACAS